MSFTDETVGIVEVKSAWRAEREVADSGVQTKPLKVKEVECQSSEKSDTAVQTEIKDNNMSMSDEPDNAKLSEFLLGVEDLMSRALIKNNQSSAFDGFVMSTDIDSDLCSALRTLNHSESSASGLSVSSLSWNATGLTLAASFAKFDHTDWCTHKSALCTWSLTNRNITKDQPDLVIDVSSCLMNVEFHPTEPALIAGGNYNGEIMIWDLAQESDQLLASSVKHDLSHSEPISKLTWKITPGKSRQYQIVSVGYDGKILIWTLNKSKKTLKLTSGALLSARSMPRQVKIKSNKTRPEMGISSISMSSIDEDVFYLGSESGGLFKCSHSHTGEIGSGDSELSDPVDLAYRPHQGPVYSISSSPYHRNIFASCSSDTTLRINSALQTEPVTQVEPAQGYLYSVQWSPVRPLVLAAVTQQGKLLIYDLKSSLTTPVQTLEASPTNQSVYTLLFNHKQRKQLATGDSAGVIRVWQLSDTLTTETSNEREQLESLINTNNE